MFSRSLASVAVLSGLAVAAPAPQQAYGSSAMSSAPAATGAAAADQSGNVPGYKNAEAPYASVEPTPITAVPTSFGQNSIISAIYTSAPLSGPGAAGPQRSSLPTGTTTHGPFSGTATTIGAVSNSPLAATVPELGPAPTAIGSERGYYNIARAGRGVG